MNTKILSSEDVLKQLKKNKAVYQDNYLAMYSSFYGGIITDPSLMLVPIDDHMVHRGDGVFEAIKVTNGGIYLLDEHLSRLSQSACKIGLQVPVSENEFRQKILATCRATGVDSGLLRIFLGRGPGGFSPNPYEPKSSQLYIVFTKATSLSEKKYKEGVSLCKSQVPMKPGFFPQVKSLNYLPNVLMKKEAIDRGFDFSVGLDEKGYLLEGATENLILINKTNQLVHPPLAKILKGTMMERLFELVEKNKLLKVRRGVKISEKDIFSARGVFMIGTSLDVVAVGKYEEKILKVSTLAKKFLELLYEDQRKGSPKLISF
jgi:4-amino-4-deoxychorismate lyase